MREKKFRVWQRGKERYVNPTFTDQLHIRMNGEVVWHSYKGFEVVTDRTIIEFYTGLKDKNGKGDELYHKDIVLVAFHYNGDAACDEEYGLIEWIEDSWVVMDKSGEYICGVWDYVHNYCGGKRGNIHENPELLK